jgi:hypothetical protein
VRDSKVSGTSAGRGSTTRSPKLAGLGVDLVRVAGTPHRVHGTGLPPLHPAGIALGPQHVDDAAGAIGAEQLSPVLLVEGDAVAPDQRDEFRRCVARQRRTGELRVLGQVAVVPLRIDVGEIAAAAAGDADLLADFRRVVDQHHARAALAGDGGAHHAGRTGANDDEIKVAVH